VSFTLDWYGHLYPEADDTLRTRLEAVIAAAVPEPSAPVIRLKSSR